MTITELTLKYECDKSPEGHNYGPFYDKWFGPLKDKVKNILEIGVFIDGRSLCVWNDFFPNAMVYGIDIQDPTTFEKIENRKPVKYFRLDGTVLSTFETLLEKTEKQQFDIIIDDASHHMDHQQITLKVAFPFLKSGGIFVIEDLHTSTITDFFKRPVDVSTQKMIKEYISTGKMISPHYSDEEQKTLEDSIAECVLEKNVGTYGLDPEGICFIRKK